MKSAAVIWQSAQPELRSVMTPISYNTWVAPMMPICVNDTTLVVQANDSIARDTVKNLYSQIITDCVNRASDSSYSLKFIDETELSSYVTAKDEKPVYSSDFFLNPKYTFESFVVGNGNNLAHAAALAVANNPGTAYNPLFIYGGVGLGKTHLMHAIGHRMRENNPGSRIIYITSETFTNEFIQSITDKTNVQFRNKYRTADVLMIDDIQFLTGRVGTQEEFFNTFNALHGSKKQIIINSDKPPMELVNLEARLVSRFEGGLIADIQPPDLETRIAILKRRAIIENIDVNEKVISYIAEKVFSNIRQLEGAFTRVVAFASLSGLPLTIETADAALKDIIPGYENTHITISYVQQVTADFYSIDVDGLTSQRRSMDVTYPRQVAMYLCKTLTGESLKSIGAAFGGRHYSTVISACDKIRSDMQSDKRVSMEINDLTKRIKAVKNAG